MRRSRPPRRLHPKLFLNGRPNAMLAGIQPLIERVCHPSGPRSRIRFLVSGSVAHGDFRTADDCRRLKELRETPYSKMTKADVAYIAEILCRSVEEVESSIRHLIAKEPQLREKSIGDLLLRISSRLVRDGVSDLDILVTNVTGYPSPGPIDSISRRLGLDITLRTQTYPPASGLDRFLDLKSEIWFQM